MKSAKWFVMILAVTIGVSVVALAEDTAGEQADAPKPRTPRLIAPFSKLTSLTAEQEAQLREIHGRYLEQIKVLQRQEKEEMMALLTDAQKAELEQMEEQAKAARKARSAEKREQEKQQAKDAQTASE